MRPIRIEYEDELDRTIDSGELVSADRVLIELCWTRSQLDHAVAKRRVFVIKHHQGEYVPSLFFDTRIPEGHIQLISAALGTVSPGGKWQFLTTAKSSLGGDTPLQALSAGHLRAVRVAARGFAER